MSVISTRSHFALKCDVCGRFVGFGDLVEGGLALHRILTPSSHLSDESYETLCPKHNTPEHRMPA